MKIIVIDSADINVKKLMKKMKEISKIQGLELEFDVWPLNKKQISGEDIREREADLLMTFNLEGFEQSTLMGSVLYNLFDCKQIHFLADRNLNNEQYLAKLLSISMFFYCAGHDYYEFLQEKYPDIPYLEEIGEWERELSEEAAARNAEKVYAAVMKTADICHLH